MPPVDDQANAAGAAPSPAASLRRRSQDLDRLARLGAQPRRLAMQIDAATTLDQLHGLAPQAAAIVASLHAGGIGIATIGDVARELNDRIFVRLWRLLAPAALIEDSCLVVMGSEGRGEQTMKTDQDNALVLRDGIDAEAHHELAVRFTETLIEFGFPRCPGNIMLSNPQWCQPLAGFRETISRWWYADDPNGPLQLAIFLDGRAIAGDASLLAQLRTHMWQIGADSDVYLARFAQPLEQFDTPGGWWQRLPGLHLGRASGFDLKKSGSFPLVHAVRVMALKHRLDALSTRDRLQGLVECGAIPAALARDAIDALEVLLRLKLQANLRRRPDDTAATNQLDPSELGQVAREELHATLAIVRQLRRHVQMHCHLTGF